MSDIGKTTGWGIVDEASQDQRGKKMVERFVSANVGEQSRMKKGRNLLE